ncbi:hypothetical protein EV424DRAFT_1354717 [Suillus variegatus]|nr:hypothetical protein EV424DRAFT_1354717 [Suillus variegatus]
MTPDIQNLKLQIEVDITRNPNTRMSNYQCRTPSPGCRVPSPDTRNSGFDILDERHLPDMFKSTYVYLHTEFRIPDTRTPKPEAAGSRVSGVRNSELDIPSSEFRTPDTRDPAASGFGVRVSGIRNSKIGFVAHQGSGVGFFHFSPGLLVNATHGRFMFLCLGV